MRIVSLCPSITETLIALGARDDLVAITKFCVHPATEVSAIPKIGGTKDPNIAQILAVKPDLVLFNEEENRREDFEALSSKVPCKSTYPRTVADVPSLLRDLGAWTGRSATAEVIARSVEEELGALRPKPFAFLYLVWRRPWMAAGMDTYISSLLTAVGGHNLVDQSGYPAVELEVRPDLHTFLPDEPFRFRPEHAAEVSAHTLGPTHLISGDDFCWHGSRTLRGLKAAQAFVDRISV